MIKSLQLNCGLHLPHTDSDWLEVPRTEVDIRRSMVVQDSLREARKPRFNASNLLNVSVMKPYVCTCVYACTCMYVSVCVCIYVYVCIICV